MATTEEFWEWVERQKSRAVRALFRYRRLAQDAVQEAVERAARRQCEFVHEEGLRNWLIRTAKNYLITEWRRHGRTQSLPSGLVERTAAPMAPYLKPLLDMISRLPEADRKLIQRRYFDGLSAADIARERIANGDVRSETRISILVGAELASIRERLRDALERLSG